MLIRLASVGLLAYSFLFIYTWMPRLPARIPVHFNAAGRADAWGDPGMLWWLLLVQLGMTGLFLGLPWLHSRFPNLGHIGVHRMRDFSPEQRDEIQATLAQMFGIDSILINGVFVYLIRGTIHAAMNPGAGLSPWPPGLMAGGTIVVSLYFVWRLTRLKPDHRRNQN